MPHDLDPRLSLLYEMTPPCRLAADIGTDHGYLICALVEDGRALRGLAADLNPLPLEKARQEAGRRGLTDRIDFLQTDGLTGVPREGLDTVLIAGMGGETILHIIESWPYHRDPGITWLLQPMTKAERLRRWLWENGFSISRERCCTAAGRVYSILEVRYTGQVISHEEWEYFLGAVDPGEGPDDLLYAQRKAEELEKIAGGLATAGDSRADVLRGIAAVIRRVGKRRQAHPTRA